MMREHSCYENMPSAFCLMRADGSERIVRCNEMMLSLFQCSTEKAFLELTGGCLRGMVIAEDYRQISAQLGVWQREKAPMYIIWTLNYAHRLLTSGASTCTCAALSRTAKRSGPSASWMPICAR